MLSTILNVRTFGDCNEGESGRQVLWIDQLQQNKGYGIFMQSIA